MSFWLVMFLLGIELLMFCLSTTIGFAFFVSLITYTLGWSCTSTGLYELVKLKSDLHRFLRRAIIPIQSPLARLSLTPRFCSSTRRCLRLIFSFIRTRLTFKVASSNGVCPVAECIISLLASTAAGSALHPSVFLLVFGKWTYSARIQCGPSIVQWDLA